MLARQSQTDKGVARRALKRLCENEPFIVDHVCIVAQAFQTLRRGGVFPHFEIYSR